MDFYIYNTLSREKELFKPLEENKVQMYVCGPTVYNYVHIGNARVSVFFDVVRRYFEHVGFDVTYIQNVTDVDDKIINAALENSEPELDISNRFTAAYMNDLNSLHVLPSHVHPRVSDHIGEIIDFIIGLIEKGLAYEIDGDVYYRVENFSNYGKLSNQNLSSLQHTSREVVFVSENKESEFDFALWKKQKNDEIAWESPWGLGRPGWHIECSAMSRKYLGDTFDIHGGGMDLCFPHHENEIAQSEGLTGKSPANVWMHNNYVTVDGQKMSKSLGNFTTVKDVLETYDGETIRFFFLSVNYRNPIDFSNEALSQATSNLEKIKNTIFNLEHIKSLEINGDVMSNNSVFDLINSTQERFNLYMHDDFNTSDSLTLLLDFAKDINIMTSQNVVSSFAAQLLIDAFKVLGDVLGFDFLTNSVTSDDEIQKLIDERDDLKRIAKSETDIEKKKELFRKSDEIRDSLFQKGILLEDTPLGTRWKKIN